MSVLDTSAVLALLLSETGHERVKRELDDDGLPLLSCVNAAEVIGVMMRKAGLPFSEAVASLQDLELNVAEPTETQAFRAAELSPIKDLALGDRFCIALAEELNETLITADRDWKSVPIRVPVEYIR